MVSDNRRIGQISSEHIPIGQVSVGQISVGKILPELYKPIESYKEKGFYLYIITNSVNGKMYVGQTTQVPLVRWKTHLRSPYLKSVKDRIPKLYNAMKKYGVENFKFSIISDAAKNLEELNELEIFIISELETVTNGYNVRRGGKNNFVTIDMLKTRSEAQMGHSVSDEVRQRLREVQLGHKYPDWVKNQRSFDLICKHYLESNKDKSHSIDEVIKAVKKFIKEKEKFLKENKIGKKYKSKNIKETRSLIDHSISEKDKDKIRENCKKDRKFKKEHTMQFHKAKKRLMWLEQLKLEVENGNAKQINKKY